MPVQPVFAAFSFMCKIVRKCHRLKPDSGIQKEENRIYIEKGHKHVSENASILPLFTFLSSIVINCKITDRWKDQEKYRRQSEVTMVDLQSVPAYTSLCRSIHGQRQAFFILCMLSHSLHAFRLSLQRAWGWFNNIWVVHTVETIVYFFQFFRGHTDLVGIAIHSNRFHA